MPPEIGSSFRFLLRPRAAREPREVLNSPISVLCRLAVGALALEASLVGLTWSNEHENEE